MGAGPTARLKSGASYAKQAATSSACRDFRPTNRLSETRFFCDPCALLRLFLILSFLCAFAALREILVLDQRRRSIR
jgi:hypothetical protein